MTPFIDISRAATELGISQASVLRLMKRERIVRFRVPGSRDNHLRKRDVPRLRASVLYEARRRQSVCSGADLP